MSRAASCDFGIALVTHSSGCDGAGKAGPVFCHRRDMQGGTGAVSLQECGSIVEL